MKKFFWKKKKNDKRNKSSFMLVFLEEIDIKDIDFSQRIVTFPTKPLSAPDIPQCK